ncbi:MAG: hypothetical protein A3F10_04565 [Coxiella sp. RIFCSPHIGHO2_12_FULL_42_15]|nr:MAG: hypothetical protein A3F10_04565 [Coxiella sp. RIFCSPHIGHO2_12_FULL_42_15]
MRKYVGRSVELKQIVSSGSGVESENFGSNPPFLGFSVDDYDQMCYDRTVYNNQMYEDLASSKCSVHIRDAIGGLTALLFIGLCTNVPEMATVALTIVPMFLTEAAEWVFKKIVHSEMDKNQSHFEGTRFLATDLKRLVVENLRCMAYVALHVLLIVPSLHLALFEGMGDLTRKFIQQSAKFCGLGLFSPLQSQSNKTPIEPLKKLSPLPV